MVKDRNKLLLIGLYVTIIIVACYAGYRYLTLGQAVDALYDTSFNQYQGPANSEKIIVEFLDYRCSYCRDMHPIMSELLARNPDVKIIYRHYPVFGRPSVIEAEVALAAGMHGKFSEAHEYLITRQEPITEREIDQIAGSLGINVDTFRHDMKDTGMGYFLLETIDMAEILGVRATPTFIIGDVVYTLEDGMPTVEKFEELLAEVYGG